MRKHRHGRTPFLALIVRLAIDVAAAVFLIVLVVISLLVAISSFILRGLFRTFPY